jgi:hypothetical protein
VARKGRHGRNRKDGGVMNENEILEKLRDGCAPFVHAGIERLGESVAKLVSVRIGRGELAVRVTALFGAQLHAFCQIIDTDGVTAYDFELDGLQRIIVDGQVN